MFFVINQVFKLKLFSLLIACNSNFHILQVFLDSRLDFKPKSTNGVKLQRCISASCHNKLSTSKASFWVSLKRTNFKSWERVKFVPCEINGRFHVKNIQFFGPGSNVFIFVNFRILSIFLQNSPIFPREIFRSRIGQKRIFLLTL